MGSNADQKLLLNIKDIRQAASEKLSTTAREFFDAGSYDQVTVNENTAAYSKYRLRPRVLVDVSKVDTTTMVLGQRIPFPLCVAPAGIQAMAHADGELATSRACARRGVHMGVSSFSNYSVEDVRAAGLKVGHLQHAMQLYTMRDRQTQLRIIRRAEEAGCAAIFLTADSPVLGIRYNETHDDGFTSFNSDSHSWAREIPWLRSVTRMEIWIKGVLTAEDVEMAIQHGCDGVVVSNHGGRQLDQAPATIDALPECVRAARGRIEVHVDGGIRSGMDIFKALALGAKCVWIGRPVIWGLAYDGEAGVSKTLDILYDEFKRCMQLCGCKSVADITPAMLGVVSRDGPIARL